jgi:hypothetical protein
LFVLGMRCRCWTGALADTVGPRLERTASQELANAATGRTDTAAFGRAAPGRRGSMEISPPASHPSRVAEPIVCGMPDGLPSQVDRLRLLGNSVVPWVARMALLELARE